MEPQTLEALKYPIGKFVRPATISPGKITAAISVLKDFPSLVKQEMKGLDQQAMGHKSLETTMGFRHAEALSVSSPLDNPARAEKAQG